MDLVNFDNFENRPCPVNVFVIKCKCLTSHGSPFTPACPTFPQIVDTQDIQALVGYAVNNIVKHFYKPAKEVMFIEMFDYVVHCIPY